MEISQFKVEVVKTHEPRVPHDRITENKPRPASMLICTSS